jgi:hypothetical protein
MIEKLGISGLTNRFLDLVALAQLSIELLGWL